MKEKIKNQESSQENHQDKSPSEGQNNVEEEVQGKITEVEESTKAIEEDQETGQDTDQDKSTNEGQNNVEEEVLGKMLEVEKSTNANEEDQEAGQDSETLHIKSLSRPLRPSCQVME